MVISNKKIAIIGGGPGGLTLARLLQLKGADVTVYERDRDQHVRLQGGALDLHTTSGLAALAKAELMDAFKKHYRPGAELVRVVDSQAKLYSDQHAKGNTESFGDKHHRPEIDRGPLRDILLDSLEPGTVVWDSQVVSVASLDDKWQVIFTNGQSIFADIIIGADGANSKIRPFVTDIKPMWTGINMVEGSIKDAAATAPTIHKLLKGGKIFAYGDEKALIVSAKGDGSLGFTTSVKSNENWAFESGINFKDNQSVLSWFKKEFEGWGTVWEELFSAEDSLFIPRPQYCMPLDLTWAAQSNITLLGDAAHWMPPFAGEGVNMAMLDALQLSEALTSSRFSSARAAFAHYEQKMFKRFSKVGRITLFNTKWMHSQDAMKNMLNMFSENIVKQWVFFVKMWWHTSF